MVGISGFFKNNEDITPVLYVDELLCSETFQSAFLFDWVLNGFFSILFWVRGVKLASLPGILESIGINLFGAVLIIELRATSSTTGLLKVFETVEKLFASGSFCFWTLLITELLVASSTDDLLKLLETVEMLLTSLSFFFCGSEAFLRTTKNFGLLTPSTFSPSRGLATKLMSGLFSEVRSFWELWIWKYRKSQFYLSIKI